MVRRRSAARQLMDCEAGDGHYGWKFTADRGKIDAPDRAGFP